MCGRPGPRGGSSERWACPPGALVAGPPWPDPVAELGDDVVPDCLGGHVEGAAKLAEAD